jgi:hypothetical protein
MIKNKDLIVNFVQKILGCGCPTEVFDDITLIENHRLCQYTILKYKIVIGGKLLIYIIENPEPEYIEDNLMNVIFMGKAERNSDGLNRFRLVLISQDIEKIKNISEEYFLSMSKDDDKMHLHLISPKDLPVL